MSRIGKLALFVGLCAGCAGPLHERPWIEVESPNFRIFSTLEPSEAVALANQLELFRTVVQFITNVPAVDSVIPTEIFIFEKTYDFRRFMKRIAVAGYFKEGMRVNYMVMRKTRELDDTRVLRHEYVHFLMNNATRLLYPAWYSEGMAEFLSTVTLHHDGQHVIVGAFPKDRKRGFRKGYPVPFDEIISARPGSTIHGNMFYEQSWALVHWQQLGRRADRSDRKEMDEYLALVEAGKTDIEAFEEAFGISMKNLRKELVSYLNGNYEAVAIPLATFDHRTVPPTTRILAKDEVSVALGQLALDHENDSLAQELFVAARTINPTNARAYAGIGDTLALRNHWSQAEPHFLRALDIAPESAENELDYAGFLQRRALSGEDPQQQKNDLADARRHYVKSYELDSEIPETFAMYGKTYLAPNEDPTRGIESLEHAYALLPSNRDIMTLLAKAYVMADRAEDARPLVERIVANTHSGDRAAKVDEMLAEIAKHEEDD